MKKSDIKNSLNNLIKKKTKDINKDNIKTNIFQRKRIALKANVKNIKITKLDIIIFVVVLIGIFIYYILSNYHRLGLVFNKNIDESNITFIETMYADTKIIPYNECVLLFENSNLFAYNIDGKKIWQKQLDQMFEPNIYTSGSYIQIVNKDTGYVYVLNGEYEVCRIKIEDNILSSKIMENGMSIIEHTSSGVNTNLDIYNKHGERLYSFKIESNSLSTYCVSQDMKYLAYAYADISGVSLNTKVDIIDINKNDIKKEIFTKPNDLIYEMYFESEKLISLFKNTVLSYNFNSLEISKFSLEEISVINLDIYKNKIAYITTNTNNGEHELCIKKIDSENINKVSISESPNYFEFMYDLIFVCFQNKIDIYNTKGIKIKEYISENIVTLPIVFNDGKYVAFSIANKIYMFKI